MRSNISRLMILFAVLALSVSSVFAQEEAASPNTFTSVLVIIVAGIIVVFLLGGAMAAANKDKDPKGE
jgi:hypothetical protein